MKTLLIGLLLMLSVIFIKPTESLKADLPDTSPTPLSGMMDTLMKKIMLNEENLPAQEVLERSFAGYYELLKNNTIKNRNILTIIDFNLPSNVERMWVIDMVKGRVLYNCLVAHGKNSGELFAEKFSNKPGSFTSSLGFYLTEKVYTGRHGTSLYLDGLEEGINNNARKRAIVIHSADYVSYDFIKVHGRLGRSHGCPAIPIELHKDIINTIKGGSCLYIYASQLQHTGNQKSQKLQHTKQF